MKAFECEEQKVLLVEEEIAQMNLETMHDLSDSPHHIKKEKAKPWKEKLKNEAPGFAKTKQKVSSFHHTIKLPFPQD